MFEPILNSFPGKRKEAAGKLIKIVLFFYILINTGVNADFTVCDSGNIDFTGIGVVEICNGGTMTGSIINIEDFEGSFINFEMGYWGNNNNYDNDINIEGNLPFGYFDQNKKMKITKVDPVNDNTVIGYWGNNNNYDNDINIEGNLPFGYFNQNIKMKITKVDPVNDNTVVGYWGNNFDFHNPEIDIENSYPLGFFDNTKTTYIKKINPNFDTPTGFLGNYILTKKKKSKKNIIIEEDNYRKFLKEKFNGGNNGYEYNIFIEEFLDLLINGSKFENEIVDEVTKNRINLYIQNSNFNIRLDKLKIYYLEINEAFEKAKNREEKFYIIKFYLNE